METAEYILLIMNCEKYAIKAQTQKNTWLREMDTIPFFHVLGDPDLHQPYEFQYDKQRLVIQVEDDYNSLPKKVIRAYAAIRSHFPSVKYVLKTDDDQILQTPHTNMFFDTITGMLERNERQHEKIHYAGNMVRVHQPYLSQYHRVHTELPEHLPILKTTYCNGRFYLLSAEAIDELLEKKHSIEAEYLEDYAIGYHLSDAKKNTLKHLASDVYFKDMDA
jgi:hypothetical protein